MSSASKGRAGDGHVLPKTWLGTQQHDANRGHAQARQPIVDRSHWIDMTKASTTLAPGFVRLCIAAPGPIACDLDHRACNFVVSGASRLNLQSRERPESARTRRQLEAPHVLKLDPRSDSHACVEYRSSRVVGRRDR